jgi:hypothetical protein
MATGNQRPGTWYKERDVYLSPYVVTRRNWPKVDMVMMGCWSSELLLQEYDLWSDLFPSKTVATY